MASKQPLVDLLPPRNRGDSRRRILDAAERLFADHGFDGCTLKDVAHKAKVNQGMIHYFFRTKDVLFREAYLRRGQPIADERLRALDAELARHPEGVIPVESLIELFLRPAVQVALQGPGGRAFVRMQARLQLDGSKFGRQLRSDLYDESSRQYLAAFADSLPGLDEDEVAWRFVFVLGAYQYALADTGRLEVVSRQRLNGRDFTQALRHIVPFLTAGMKAPGRLR